ncbi:hypothetical protein CHUAL_011657 [Chamberlinius hualienensis]
MESFGGNVSTNLASENGEDYIILDLDYPDVNYEVLSAVEAITSTELTVPEQNFTDIQSPYEVNTNVPFPSTLMSSVSDISRIENQENGSYRLVDFSRMGRRRGRPPKTSTPNTTRSLPRMHIPGSSLAFNSSINTMLNSLNSSGEFSPTSTTSSSSSSFMSVPNNTPVDYFTTPDKIVHKESERKRRIRVKNACEQLRNLVPFVTDKTDNARILENAVQFLTYIKTNYQPIYNEYTNG